MLFKGKTDQFVVSGFEEMKCINISHHDHLELTKNLSINDSEIIINSLEEDHMVDVNVEWISNSSQSINTIFRNVLHDLIDLLWLVVSSHRIDQDSEKLYKFRVVVVDAEVKAVEQSHGILFQVLSMLRNDISDLLVECLLLKGHLLAKSVCFLKPVSYLMMEVYFLSELLEVVLLDLVIHLIHDFVLSFVDLDGMLNLVNHTIVVEVIDSGVTNSILGSMLVKLVVIIVDSVFEGQGTNRLVVVINF